MMISTVLVALLDSVELTDKIVGVQGQLDFEAAALQEQLGFKANGLLGQLGFEPVANLATGFCFLT